MASRIEHSAIDYWRTVVCGAGDWPSDRRAAFSNVESLFDSSGGETADLRRFVSALEVIGEAARNPALSWCAGLAAGDDGVGGDAAPYIWSARTLGEAMQRLCAAYPALQGSTLMRLAVDEGEASLSYKILDPDIWPRHQDALFSLALYARLIKAAAPDAWSRVTISMEVERDFTRAEVSEFVRARVMYGQSANALIFPAALLERPIAQATGLAGGGACVFCPTPGAPPKNTSDRVREVIFSEFDESPLSEEEVARRLRVSERTLRRRLSEEGATFRDIVEDCRLRQARLELRRLRRESLAQIGMRVGYSDQSNFTRAFVRWSGMTPGRFRMLESEGKLPPHQGKCGASSRTTRAPTP